VEARYAVAIRPAASRSVRGWAGREPSGMVRGP
jgi:hypothetical protein